MIKKIVIENCYSCPHSFLDYKQDENDDIGVILICDIATGNGPIDGQEIPKWCKLEDN